LNATHAQVLFPQGFYIKALGDEDITVAVCFKCGAEKWWHTAQFNCRDNFQRAGHRSLTP